MPLKYKWWNGRPTYNLSENSKENTKEEAEKKERKKKSHIQGKKRKGKEKK